MAAVLELVGVSKRFGTLTVLEDLHLTVGAGESVGVVGPNGAGKTTMLNVVAGDLRPTSGTVLLDGVDVSGHPAHQRCRAGVGRTSQIPRPFEGLSVYENVMVGARSPEDAESALQRTGLLAKAPILAGALTLLERKRLELARALATRPRLLLLDEIAGGLTDMEVSSLVATIREVRETGVTIVWIEHIVRALLEVVDHLLALDYGRTIMFGAPHDVMASDEVRRIYLGQD